MFIVCFVNFIKAMIEYNSRLTFIRHLFILRIPYRVLEFLSTLCLVASTPKSGSPDVGSVPTITLSIQYILASFLFFQQITHILYSRNQNPFPR